MNFANSVDNIARSESSDCLMVDCKCFCISLTFEKVLSHEAADIRDVRDNCRLSGLVVRDSLMS